QLDWGAGYLVDLDVLDDGAIVALSDLSSVLCDHFGCGGPTVEAIESHLDGRAWQPASPRHLRAAAFSSAVRPAVAPPASSAGTHLLDSHRLVLQVAANRAVVRYTAAGWRVLFTGAAS
nr:hypothetical protein [Deltaproteobacteria bacterium]